MNGLKIAMIGTRGIPNNYGGFEQAAGFLAAGLAAKGHRVTVYNSHNHPYKGNEWNGVEITHCYDPESKTGTAGQFIYDLNCIRNARRKNFDILLFFGYTSSSVWGRFYPKKTIIVSNMDGLEWKRAKYAAPVRKYLQLAEKWAIQFSRYYIADSKAIQEYLSDKYKVSSCFIPYGAEVVTGPDPAIPGRYGVLAEKYFLLIARMEPENNIETILDGYVQSGSLLPFIVIGNMQNAYGKRIHKKYKQSRGIIFAGSVFDTAVLQSLRAFCRLYFHGHSVGGTNPSLLEAMAAGALISAHENAFNKSVLGDDAYYFSNPGDIRQHILSALTAFQTADFKKANLEKIKKVYNWDIITSQYETFLLQCYNENRS